jgi:hypothetical protein
MQNYVLQENGQLVEVHFRIAANRACTPHWRFFNKTAGGSEIWMFAADIHENERTQHNVVWSDVHVGWQKVYVYERVMRSVPGAGIDSQ